MGKVWIGFDGSDIEGSPYFDKAIVSYGTTKEDTVAYCCASNKRLRHFCSEEIEFVASCMLSCLQSDDTSKFVFSNQYESRFFGSFANHFLACNPLNLLRLLNSKTLCREGFRGIVPMLPYLSLPSGMVTWNHLRDLQPGFRSFVIQIDVGAGGRGTYIVQNQEDLEKTIANFDCDQILSASPLVPECISVNQTLIIGSKSSIRFQPSIQLISDGFLYRGADFAGFRDLDSSIADQVMASSSKMAFELERLGYRGIVGFDFLVDDGIVYFSEVNPRFQGSSFLLDRVLYRELGIGLYELNEHAFSHIPFSELDIAVFEALPITGRSVDHFYEEIGDELDFLGKDSCVSDGAQQRYSEYEKGAFLYREFSY